MKQTFTIQTLLNTEKGDFCTKEVSVFPGLDPSLTSRNFVTNVEHQFGMVYEVRHHFASPNVWRAILELMIFPQCSRKYREPSRIPDLHPAVAIKILIKPDKNSLFREGHIHGELKRMGRNPKLLKHVIELLEQTPEMLVFELADFDLNSLVFGSRRCLSRTSMVPSIIQHVLLGVGALHEQNFVHCDIKLENVLLVRDETSGKLLAKIADLGGASKDKEEFGSFHFDPRYLPPEMIMLSKEAFDYEVPKKAMDMWAVGVLLLL